MRKLTTLLLILAVMFAFVSISLSAEEVTHKFVGPKKCKSCHKDIHTAWSETAHAKAFTKLSAEEQKDEKCIACHTSGIDKKGALIEGVTCEACHGAGGDYKSAKIMSKKKWAADPETHKKMAIEAGLVYPTEETCVRCHTAEGNKNFKEFKFETAKAKVHKVAAE